MEKTIKVNNIHLSYQDEGNGEVCFLVHGTRDRKEVWNDLIKELSPYYRVIAVDLRAHGNSEWPKEEEAYKLELFFSDILELINQLSIGRIYYIGHSFGASIGIWMALNYPDKVNKLVLVGCGKGTEEDNTRKHFKPSTKLEDLQELQKFMLTKFFPINENISIERNEEIKNQIVSNWNRYHGNPIVHQNLEKLPRPVFEDVYQQIQTPALLVFGDKDEVGRPENGTYLKTKLPNSQLEIMNGCAHYMFLERPKAFNNIVMGFLQTSL